MTITMLIYAIVRGRPMKMKLTHASVRAVLSHMQRILILIDVLAILVF